MTRTFLRKTLLLGAVAFVSVPARDAAAQSTVSDLDRGRAHIMLRTAREDLERHYFDTTYAGLDLDQRFDSAARRIDKATSNGEMFGVIAQIFADLNDSHTWFVPPQRAARVRYGWELLTIGDSVYVLDVKPKSGVERAGLRPGDLLLSVNGIQPVRANLAKLRYLVEVLRPAPELRVQVQSPGQPVREVVVPADIKVGRARVDLSSEAHFRHEYLEWTDAVAAERDVSRHKTIGDVLIWKLDAFTLPPDDFDAEARKLDDHRAVVLDLRGNPGGYVVTLQRAVAHFLDKPTLIAIGKTRTRIGLELDTVRARPVRKPFAGRLIVLVDSRSASASEMFARIMQLETRATVIGDRTAGSVVNSRFFFHQAGSGRIVPYGFTISVRDVILADGSRLEGRGVMPDEELLPTAADLAAGRDPVLSRAVALAGGSLDPVEAGKLFPLRWR